MNNNERLAAQKASGILRSARKQLGFTQKSIADRLCISQSALSKLEHGILVPSAPQWFEFCNMTGIAPDSLLTGRIERTLPAKIEEATLERVNSPYKEGGFRIPKRYANYRGSKIRAMLPFISYFISQLGQKKFSDYMSHRGIDEDFLIDLDNQVNLNFCLDISRELIQKKVLKPKDMKKLAQQVSRPEAHGKLGSEYNQCKDSANLLHQLVLNSKFYECNFHYKIEAQNRSFLDLSVTPAEHLDALLDPEDFDLNDFLCQYKRHYFASFASYGKPHDESGILANELECQYKGAPKCVYRLPTVN